MENELKTMVYDKPFKVTIPQYDFIISIFAGSVAGRFDPTIQSYVIKIWYRSIELLNYLKSQNINYYD